MQYDATPTDGDRESQRELGTYIRNVRKQRGLTQSAVAEAIGMRQPSYADLESGARSSNELKVWVGIAIALQLRPEELLRKVWAARGPLGLGMKLPARDDPRHEMILQLAIEQSGVEDVLLALREATPGGRVDTLVGRGSVGAPRKTQMGIGDDANSPAAQGGHSRE